jgi:hypothetical protein
MDDCRFHRLSFTYTSNELDVLNKKLEIKVFLEIVRVNFRLCKGIIASRVLGGFNCEVNCL